MTTYLKALQANFERRAKLQEELRGIDEQATVKDGDEVKLRAYTEDEQKLIAEFRAELQTVDSRITTALEMEVREQEIAAGVEGLAGILLDRDSGEVTDNRSIGQRFAGTDEYRAWAEGGAHGSHAVDIDGMDFRAVTDVTLGATSGGALTRPQRLDRVGRDFLDRRTYLLDLLPHITVSQAAIEYVQDQTPLADLPDGFREVAESGVKPQVGITLAVIAEAMAVVAAWVNVTRQTAADIPQIQSYLDNRLRYGLKRRADGQSINGTGVSPNLKGLLNRTGILTYTPGAEARYKSIRKAITVMENAEAVPEIIVLNPSDAELFDLSNDTSAGLHAIDADGGMRNGPDRTAWGLTQVRSTAVAAGTALLIDPMAVTVFDRQQPTAYMTDSHASNFTSNILTLLLEARLGLGLFDPKGVLKLTFNGTT